MNSKTRVLFSLLKIIHWTRETLPLRNANTEHNNKCDIQQMRQITDANARNEQRMN